jgi:hypothetical protein
MSEEALFSGLDIISKVEALLDAYTLDTKRKETKRFVASIWNCFLRVYALICVPTIILSLSITG